MKVALFHLYAFAFVYSVLFVTLVKNYHHFLTNIENKFISVSCIYSCNISIVKVLSKFHQYKILRLSHSRLLKYFEVIIFFSNVWSISLNLNCWMNRIAKLPHSSCHLSIINNKLFTHSFPTSHQLSIVWTT